MKKSEIKTLFNLIDGGSIEEIKEEKERVNKIINKEKQPRKHRDKQDPQIRKAYLNNYLKNYYKTNADYRNKQIERQKVYYIDHKEEILKKHKDSYVKKNKNDKVVED